jgi:hypothetical protein
MDPQVSASFIPKKPLAEARGGGGGAVFGLFFLIAILIFVASVVAAVAAFGYTRVLSSTLDKRHEQLDQYKLAYDLGSIQKLVKFDSRINEAKKLLQTHLAPSAIFGFLSQQTYTKVQLTSFDYTFGGGKAQIRLAGIADSFETVALQSDKLGANQALKDVIFSDIAIQDKGKVSFTVSATLDPNMVLYKTTITGVTVGDQASSSEATSTPQ